MKHILFFSFLALTLVACQTPTAESEEPSPPVTNAADSGSDRAALEAITAAYQTAIRAGDHATIASLHANDAVIHPANRPPERGREALDAYFAANDSEPQNLTFTTDVLVVSDAGNMAYEVGTTTGGGVTGKYLTVFRRTPEGWMIVADSWSDNVQPTSTN